MCDDLIPFDLIENKGDEIFLLHKSGEIYFYYTFLFIAKIAGRFDEFIDNLYVVPKKKKKLLEK